MAIDDFSKWLGMRWEAAEQAERDERRDRELV